MIPTNTYPAKCSWPDMFLKLSAAAQPTEMYANAQSTHAGAVQARNLRYRIVLMPTVSGTSEWNTGRQSGDEDGDAAPPVDVTLGAGPVLRAETLPQAACLDLRSEVAAQRETDTFARKGSRDHQRQERQVFREAGNGGAGDDHDGVAGDHEANENRGFEKHFRAGERGAQQRIDRLDQAEDPAQGVVHGRSGASGVANASIRARQVDARADWPAIAGPSIHAVMGRMPCSAFTAHTSRASSSRGCAASYRISVPSAVAIAQQRFRRDAVHAGQASRRRAQGLSAPPKDRGGRAVHHLSGPAHDNCPPGVARALPGEGRPARRSRGP